MPKANLRNLMLRPDVVGAVKDGKFHIHAVATIDEGIEVLTGMPAGERDQAGHYPERSINGCVEKKFLEYSERLRQIGATHQPQAGATAKD
jgi:predicted ATP-dependent protease